jgi:hypothetical protein
VVVVYAVCYRLRDLLDLVGAECDLEVPRFPGGNHEALWFNPLNLFEILIHQLNENVLVQVVYNAEHFVPLRAPHDILEVDNLRSRADPRQLRCC